MLSITKLHCEFSIHSRTALSPLRFQHGCGRSLLMSVSAEMVCLRLSGFRGVWDGKVATRLSLITEKCVVRSQSAPWFSLKLMNSFIAQLNLFQNLPREKLILLCITLLGAKPTKTYLASFQGEKRVVYKADLTVRRPEHSLKIPCYCFKLFSRINKKLYHK